MRPLARFLLWEYERGSAQYEALALLLLLSLFLAPVAWFGDPMVASP